MNWSSVWKRYCKLSMKRRGNPQQLTNWRIETLFIKSRHMTHYQKNIKQTRGAKVVRGNDVEDRKREIWRCNNGKSEEEEECQSDILQPGGSRGLSEEDLWQEMNLDTVRGVCCVRPKRAKQAWRGWKSWKPPFFRHHIKMDEAMDSKMRPMPKWDKTDDH